MSSDLLMPASHSIAISTSTLRLRSFPLRVLHSADRRKGARRELPVLLCVLLAARQHGARLEGVPPAHRRIPHAPCLARYAFTCPFDALQYTIFTRSSSHSIVVFQSAPIPNLPVPPPVPLPVSVVLSCNSLQFFVANWIVLSRAEPSILSAPARRARTCMYVPRILCILSHNFVNNFLRFVKMVNKYVNKHGVTARYFLWITNLYPLLSLSLWVAINFYVFISKDYGNLILRVQVSFKKYSKYKYAYLYKLQNPALIFYFENISEFKDRIFHHHAFS